AAFHPAFLRHRRDDGTGPMPISDGSTPDEANALMRASGSRPSSRARFSLVTRTAAALSLRPEALAAVTVPSFAKAGFKPATDSSVAPDLMNSSAVKAIGSP